MILLFIKKNILNKKRLIQIPLGFTETLQYVKYDKCDGNVWNKIPNFKTRDLD